ncbi:MAG: Aspartate-semialdehyde dehydrogenase [Chlamydiia bacterium]|nr:Aspartate-semialdehyde dehydrogenase [Chlamydiia bacterium]MCH9618901.1 Aspartate-semialdehyde dehydrogenase [Chlamydiia bacterium]MCH9624568.1 Aspartate-semialdehyde dehydrogenase [Chlamydiia bacterium]
MMRAGIIGHDGMCGRELVKLLEKPPKIFTRFCPLDFSDIDVLFMAISSKDTYAIAEKALNEKVKVIDLSSTFRNDPSIPLILPTVNSQLINNFFTLISLPNCIVSILLTALAPLHTISPISKMILSTYQAASGAGKKGIKALNSHKTIAPFPYPLKDNLFLHESEKGENGLCGEEEKIIFETRKILDSPKLPISVRCVRLPIARVHSIHAIITFEQKIHNVEELLKQNDHIQLHPSPHPLVAEHSSKVFVGDIREDKNSKNTYDFWICGDQLIRGAALNAYEVYQFLHKKSLLPK